MLTYIKPNELKEQLVEYTKSLLHLAKELSWNEISPNCIYHLWEDPNDGTNINPWYLARAPKEELKLQTLDELMPFLNQLYPDLYDIKLFIRHAYKHVTIIDVRYIKWDFDFGTRNSDGEPLPFLAAKVELPNHYTKGKKIDINWQHDTFKHRIIFFWVRTKFRFWLLFVYKLKIFKHKL